MEQLVFIILAKTEISNKTDKASCDFQESQKFHSYQSANSRK